jgi:hypothetical protein
MASDIQWDRPILIGSCPSSGSTLLSVILDNHPQLYCGPELELFAHPFLWRETGPTWQERMLRYTHPNVDVTALPEWTLENGVCEWNRFWSESHLAWYQADADRIRERLPQWIDARGLVEDLYREPMTRAGKTIWVEKSPPNLYAIPAFLEYYPNGRAIVVLRDGRDMICSQVKRGYSFARAAANWVLETALSLAVGAHPRAHVLRYEDLVVQPRETLQRLMDFLSLETALDQLLDYQNSRRAQQDSSITLGAWKQTPKEGINPKSVGRWRKELSPFHLQVLDHLTVQEEIPTLESLAGKTGRELLAAAGYTASQTGACTGRRFASWLVREGSTLRGVIDQHDFYHRCSHVDFDAALPAEAMAALRGSLFALQLTSAVHHADDLARIEQLATELAQTRQELAQTQAALANVRHELRVRTGLRNALKEAYRSSRDLVLRRPAG